MTIQEDIQGQCSFTREEDWLDLVARVDCWASEPDLCSQQLHTREWLRDRLFRVWHHLGRPEGKIQWPAGVTLADVQICDVYSTDPSRVDAASSPREVAKVWWEHAVPVGSSSSLIQVTQWLPLVAQLVEVWTKNPGSHVVNVLAHDDHGVPQLWLELAQSGIEKLEAQDAGL